MTGGRAIGGWTSAGVTVGRGSGPGGGITLPVMGAGSGMGGGVTFWAKAEDAAAIMIVAIGTTFIIFTTFPEMSGCAGRTRTGDLLGMNQAG